MKILRNFIYIYLFLFLFAAGVSAAEVTNTVPASNDGKYKNYYSDGWFGTYALREFDKVAPTPGVNWFVEDAQDWLARAQRDGWVVKSKPAEAVNGAIIVGYNEG